MFTRDEAAHAIKQQTIGSSPGPKDFELSVERELVDVSIATKEQPLSRMPNRTFTGTLI